MVSVDEISTALQNMGTVYFAERDINLFAGFEQEIANFINEFQVTHSGNQFVGQPYLAESQNQISLDPAHGSFWKASTTTNWKLTPTGLGTLDNVFPTTAAYVITMNTQTIAHWAMLLGFLEVGSANNLARIAYTNINGKKRGYTTRFYQSRFGDVKLVKLAPAIRFMDRGQINIDMEFETNAPTEVIPLAVHVAPFELLTSDYTTKSAVTAA